MLGLFRDKTAASAFNVFRFFPLPSWLCWWHNNLWGWRKREKSSGIYACRSVKVLDPCLHFRAAKNEHAPLTIDRCSSTCWHLKTPVLAQIHHRTKKPKTNSLFNQLNTSRASWLSWKLCDFGSSGTRFEFHRGQLFISVSLFFLTVRTAKTFKVFHMNGNGLRTYTQKKSIKTFQQVFIGFKNLPAGYFRDLQTSSQSMCSNWALGNRYLHKNQEHFKARFKVCDFALTYTVSQEGKLGACSFCTYSGLGIQTEGRIRVPFG